MLNQDLLKHEEILTINQSTEEASHLFSAPLNQAETQDFSSLATQQQHQNSFNTMFYEKIADTDVDDDKAKNTNFEILLKVWWRSTFFIFFSHLSYTQLILSVLILFLFIIFSSKKKSSKQAMLLSLASKSLPQLQIEPSQRLRRPPYCPELIVQRPYKAWDTTTRIWTEPSPRPTHTIRIRTRTSWRRCWKICAVRTRIITMPRRVNSRAVTSYSSERITFVWRSLK